MNGFMKKKMKKKKDVLEFMMLHSARKLEDKSLLCQHDLDPHIRSTQS